MRCSDKVARSRAVVRFSGVVIPEGVVKWVLVIPNLRFEVVNDKQQGRRATARGRTSSYDLLVLTATVARHAG